MENVMTPIYHATKEYEVANFHGQTSDAYAYVWMVQGSLFSWITLWNLCHTLNRCKVAYFHRTLHDSYSMQRLSPLAIYSAITTNRGGANVCIVLVKWVCQTFIYGYIVTKYGCNCLKYIFPNEVANFHGPCNEGMRGS